MSEDPMLAAFEHNGKQVSAEAFYAIACDPQRSVAVEACAGAGKTWILVSRIVRALLDGIDTEDDRLRVAPHEILAITFTKRAASEMRERLYQWLEEFADAPEDVLRLELQRRGATVATADSGEASARRLSQLYRRLIESGRQVQIRTFHGWFAALLRAAPMAVLQQLGLPLNYELLEDDEPATRLVWRRFYQAIVQEPQAKADFEALVLEHGRFQTEKALAAILGKRVEFALADAGGIVDGSVQPFGVAFPALGEFDHPADVFERPSTRERWLSWASSLAREANKTPRKAAQAVRDAFAAPASAVTPGPTDSSWRLELLRQGFFVANEDRLTQHLGKFQAAQEAGLELGQMCAARDQHAAWLYQQRMVRLARVLLTEYAALKRERGWVDMSDVERAGLVLLSDPVLSGWVQERLDARVRQLLIDEFQDTNPLQWQALASWLGSYAGAAGRTPSVFIVGDPKQSIYRFRRAEPQVFRAAQDFIANGLGGDLLSCDHTRRNAMQVTALVNAAMAAAREADHFDGFREHSTSSPERGLVALLPPIARPKPASNAIDNAPEGLLSGDGWRDSLVSARELPEETLRTLEARQVAQWVANQVDGGRKPSDVMVLSRRRAGLLPLELELRALRIEARVGEKTALIDCCEVLDLVALLDALVSSRHDLSLARALKSPLFALSDDALVALALRRRAHELPWFKLLQQTWPQGHELCAIGPTLARWKNWLDQLPPHDALQSIYSDGDVLARFAMAAPAAQRNAVVGNLRALLGAALQMSGGRYVTPYAFVRALKAGALRAPAPAADNALRLLTIHGAKGLEAHTVVLMDTDTPARAAETMTLLVDWPGHLARPARLVFLASERRPPACAALLLQTEQAQRHREELNALYVALTRARHSLVISSITPHREAAASWWQRLSPLIAQRVVAVAGGASRPEGSATSNPEFSLPELPQGPAGLPQAAAPNAALAGAASAGDASDSDSDAARFGKAMHRLLEWGDASAANAAAAGGEFGLDADQQAQMVAMARCILNGQGAWAWDESILAWHANEVELIFQGELLRLDRLVRRSDTGQWWVLDFKSSHAPDHQSELVAQLQTYRDAIQAIHAGETVRAAFLSASGALIELPAGRP